MDIMCPHLDVDKNATMFRIFRVYKKKDFDNCHVISQSDVPKEGEKNVRPLGLNP